MGLPSLSRCADSCEASVQFHVALLDQVFDDLFVQRQLVLMGVVVVNWLPICPQVKTSLSQLAG